MTKRPQTQTPAHADMKECVADMEELKAAQRIAAPGMPGQGLRVAQWGTGNVGRRALAAIIDHPQLELVGVHVFNADKVGKDAGDLADRPPAGIIATNDPQQLITLHPTASVTCPARSTTN